MSEESKFIEMYPKVDMNLVAMAWNGKRGLAFDDANQGFRERVILCLEKDLDASPHDLIYSLMHEEAEWANKTLTFRYYLPRLTEHLLVGDFEAYIEKIVETYSVNLHAMKALVDLKSDDDQVKEWLKRLESQDKMNADTSLNYDAVMTELQLVLDTRAETAKKEEAFEKYVKHKDPFPTAFKKEVIRIWHEAESHYLALFFIIPATLLMGYYFFGFAILYGMLPVFRALIAIYGIYRLVNWVIG